MTLGQATRRAVFPALLTASAYALSGVQEPVPIAGQPISFAADHDGTCAPSTLTNCTVTYQLYVNGVKIGSEVPISSTPGVVKVTISGLAEGSHSARMSAIGRGTDATGKATTVEALSAALAFTVLPNTDPGDPPIVGVPQALRVTWPAPPPDLGDQLIDSQSNWILDGADDIEVDIPVTLQVGQTVLLASFQPNSGTRIYTATASNGMPLKLLATAFLSGTRGVHLWLGTPTAAGSVTLFVRSNLTASFRASALILNTQNLDVVPWSGVEAVDTKTHACGPSPWPVEHDGNVLCVVLLNSGSNMQLQNAVWVPPTTGSLGGWMVRSAGETEDGQIRFTTTDARRSHKIALRIW